MSQHTKEPWTVFKAYPTDILKCTGGGNKLVAELDGCTMPESIGGTPEANAARIVACVNGCAGLNPRAYQACVEALQAPCVGCQLGETLEGDEENPTHKNSYEGLNICTNTKVNRQALAHAQEGT